MSPQVYIISDLHLGHKGIIDFVGKKRGGTDSESHDAWLIGQWNSVVTKRDVVIVLGDVAFSRAGLEKVAKLNGTKHLVLGNHDTYPTAAYQKYFTIKPGLYKYKGLWLTHAPIHPDELRGKMNVHGHVHAETIRDSRYINVCVEALRHGKPIPFSNILSWDEFYKKQAKEKV